MFRKIDDFFLQEAQKFSDSFQRITGKTKFFLEKWSLILFLVILCVQTLLLYAELDSSLIVIGFLPCLLNILMWVPVIRRIETDEAAFLEHGTLNFSELHDFYRRSFLVLLALSLELLHVFIWHSLPHLWIFFCGWIYFAACIPRPPSKSKLRQWLDDLAPDPVPATSH